MLFWHKHNLDKSLTDLANFTPFPGKYYDNGIFQVGFSHFCIPSDYCNVKCTYIHVVHNLFNCGPKLNLMYMLLTSMYSVCPTVCGILSVNCKMLCVIYLSCYDHTV